MGVLGILRRTGAIALAMVAAMAMTTPAMAACGVTVESVAEAEVVFVGLLSDVSADGNNATFNVQEIWHGSGLVLGGAVAVETTNAALQRLELPPSGAPASRYLVLAHAVAGQLHTGDSCWVFPFPWDASYAAFRPADAPPPAASPAADAGFPAAVVAAAAALLVLAVVSAVAFRRRSSPV